MLPEPLDEATQTALRPQLLTLRILVFAMAAGVFAFQAVVLFLHGPPNASLVVLEPIALVGYAMMPMSVVMSFVLPLLLRSAAKKAATPATPQAAAMGIQTETIIACALLEGAAFVNLVAVMMHHSAGNLVLANALLLLLICRFPLTEDGYFQRIQRRMAAREENLPRREPG